MKYQLIIALAAFIFTTIFGRDLIMDIEFKEYLVDQQPNYCVMH